MAGNNPKGVDWSETQTSNWNVAKPFTTEKILKWLVFIDEYMNLAVFGTSDIYGDVFMRDTNLRNQSRLHGLRRLIHAIVNLIRNTKFALKKPTHKQDFDNYRDRLNFIEKNLNKLKIEKKRGNKIVELQVNESLFDDIIRDISEMIDEINYRLNFSDLIFTHTEEYDPSKVKEAFKDRFINRG